MLPSLIDLSGNETPPIREGAGFLIRGLARGIDLLVHFAVSAATGIAAAFLIVIGSAIQGVPPDEPLARLSVTSPLGYLAALIGGTAMHVLAEGLHGSTLGKRMCGLTVISEDGTPATLLGALKRDIAYYWDALFFGLIAYHKMAESPRRQRYGDEWGRTQVVGLSTLDPNARRSWLRFAAATTAGMAVDGAILFIEVGYRLA